MMLAVKQTDPEIYVHAVILDNVEGQFQSQLH